MGQRHYSLDGHCVENRSGDIFPADIPGNEILDVRLAEHPAPRGHRIYPSCLECQVTEHIHRDIEDNGHLVNESPGATGAVAVHPEISRIARTEEDHLGILPADVYHRGYTGIVLPDGIRRRHDFLDKRQPRLLRHPHSDRAREAHRHFRITCFLLQGIEKFGQDLPDPGSVPHIYSMVDIPLIIRRHHLGRGGAYIDSYVQHLRDFKTVAPPVPETETRLTLLSDTNVKTFSLYSKDFSAFQSAFITIDAAGTLSP